MTAGGVLLTFGSKIINYPGAGPLAIMTAAFVAAIFWKKIDSFSVSMIWYRNNKSLQAHQLKAMTLKNLNMKIFYTTFQNI